MRPERPSVRIGELRLRAPGLSRAAAERLARDVAVELARGAAPPRALGTLSLRAPIAPGAGPRAQASHIAAAIRRGWRGSE